MATSIFGIVNMTEDSFSDGGRFLKPAAALEHAMCLWESGADVLDIGASSSHPDAMDVSPDQEIERLQAVLPALLRVGCEISVDSYHPKVQRYALQQGVHYLNDIHGFSDPTFYPELASTDAQLVVMHSIHARGKAIREVRDAETVWQGILAFFEERLGALITAGVHPSRLIADPGMGFFLGANPEPSLLVLKRLPELSAFLHKTTGQPVPILLGVSRKSFLRSWRPEPVHDIAAMSLAAEILAAQQGAAFIRTHEPRPLRDALDFQAAVVG